MARVSGAPIYGPFSSLIGTGAVGGRMPSFESMGKQAGQIVDRLLSGVPRATLALPHVMPNQLTIDWRQAHRWGIDDAQIPDDAIVHFRRPTFWQAYRSLAIAIAAVVLIQAGLIAALLLEQRRRRRAEVAVQVQRSELAHASRLLVAGELTASIAHEINHPLGAILASADAAELMLQSGVDRREDLLRIVTRIRRDDLRASV
jgi:signal transduction histidine kinase